MQYISPITKDNDIVNKKYVDNIVSEINTEIEKTNESLENKADKTDLDSKADKSELENIETQIGNLENLETENKSNLVNAINEVKASAGGGTFQMTTTVLCNSSAQASAITLSENAGNFDLVVGYVEGYYTIGTKSENLFFNTIVWCPKSQNTLYLGTIAEVTNYQLRLTKTSLYITNTQNTSNRYDITSAKLYGIKFSNS